MFVRFSTVAGDYFETCSVILNWLEAVEWLAL
jgi:hypothetical protein